MRKYQYAGIVFRWEIGGYYGLKSSLFLGLDDEIVDEIRRLFMRGAEPDFMVRIFVTPTLNVVGKYGWRPWHRRDDKNGDVQIDLIREIE